MKFVQRIPCRHLEIDTRDHVRRRPAHRERKLTDHEVYRARIDALEGVPHRLIASQLGVHQSTVTRAVNGETYQHVPHPAELEEAIEYPIMDGWHPYEAAREVFLTADVIDVELRPPLPTMTAKRLVASLPDPQCAGGCPCCREAGERMSRRIEGMIRGSLAPR